MREPIWYIILDFVTRIIIGVIVSVVVVSIMQHRPILEVFTQLLERLSMLL